MAVWLARPPGFGGEAMDEPGIEVGSFARRQVVGEDNDGLAQMLELLAALTEQLAEDAFFEVEQVADAAGHGAADILQRLGVQAHGPADGVLGGEVLLADQGFDFLAQGRVGEKNGVSTEDGAVLFAEAKGDEVFAGRASPAAAARATRRRSTSAST